MLVRPSPLPDELDRGYLGRVMRMNGFPQKKAAIENIVRMFQLEYVYGHERSNLELLSLMAGQSLEQFAQRHSTIPLRRAITSSRPDMSHGSSAGRTLWTIYGLAPMRPGAYLCRTCVLTDVAFRGISYWRREHQVPGLLWCPHHRHALGYVESEDAFLVPPSSCMDHAKLLSETSVAQFQSNLWIGRFLEIASGLSGGIAPLPARSVAAILRKRATNVGVQTRNGRVTQPLLSDRICDAFPVPWLAMAFPSLQGKKHGQIGQVDRIFSVSNSTSWVYMLAASVLYDSADDALNSLFSARENFADRPGRKILEVGGEDHGRLVTDYV